MDYDTGTAEDGTLRSMRVINKGFVFKADVQIEDTPEGQKAERMLEQCVKIFTHLGLARTRGLGEIYVRLASEENLGAGSPGGSDGEACVPFLPGADRLDYQSRSSSLSSAKVLMEKRVNPHALFTWHHHK